MVYRGGQNLEDMEICHLRVSCGLFQASSAYAILVNPKILTGKVFERNFNLKGFILASFGIAEGKQPRGMKRN